MEQPWAQIVLPHTRLTIGCQEETELFTQQLPKYFANEESSLIKEFFKRYMDDVVITCPKYLDFNNFSIFLNNLNLAIKYTFEKAKVIIQNSGSCQAINFQDVSVMLHPHCTIETDIYYKGTNAHGYLPYDSAHPDHSKDDVSYNLTKQIIVFVPFCFK